MTETKQESRVDEKNREPLVVWENKDPSLKRCYLHIGMMKTGSTSIQKNLDAVEEPADWCLLKVGSRANMGLAVRAMFSKNPQKCHKFARREKSQKQLAEMGAKLRVELAETIRSTDKKSIIISGESMVGLKHSDLVTINDFLKPHFDEIRIIGYVRSPVSCKTSVFQQKVKGKGKKAFQFKEVGYRDKFRKFDQVFGKANVLLRKFDPPSFPGSCIVQDFCAQLGIAGPAPDSIKRKNESLSREACGMLFAYRKFGPPYGVGKEAIKENARLISAFVSMRGEKLKIAKTLVAPVTESEIADIAWIEKRLGVSLHDDFVQTGSEITSEDDLLKISRESCVQFSQKFAEIFDVVIPDEMIPEGAVVAPQDVVKLVDYCRQLIIRQPKKKDRRAAK